MKSIVAPLTLRHWKVQLSQISWQRRTRVYHHTARPGTHGRGNKGRSFSKQRADGALCTQLYKTVHLPWHKRPWTTIHRDKPRSTTNSIDLTDLGRRATRLVWSGPFAHPLRGAHLPLIFVWTCETNGFQSQWRVPWGPKQPKPHGFCQLSIPMNISGSVFDLAIRWSKLSGNRDRNGLISSLWSGGG